MQVGNGSSINLLCSSQYFLHLIMAHGKFLEENFPIKDSEQLPVFCLWRAETGSELKMLCKQVQSYFRHQQFASDIWDSKTTQLNIDCLLNCT